MTASGINGLDTGSESVSTWYYIWLVGKADGTHGALLSVSSIAPTLPSGYTYKRLIGAIYNDASSNFVSMAQKDNRVVVGAAQMLSGGTATTPTPVMITNIPPIAKLVSGWFAGVGTGTVYILSTALSLGIILISGSYINAPFTLPIIENQTFYYYINGAVVGTIDVSGWEY